MKFLSMAVACALAPAVLGDVLPFSSSNSVDTSGTVGVTATVSNCSDSSFLCSPNPGGESITVPFTLTLSLPTAPDFALSSASLAFDPNNSPDIALAENITNVAPIFTGCFFGCEFAHSNFLFFMFDSGELTNISSSSHSVSVFGTNFDLLALGFGSDLLDGGTLTLTGVRRFTLQAELIESGFNAATTFDESGSDTGTEQAMLSLDGVVATPEPRASSAMLVIGLVGLLLVRCTLMKAAEKSDSGVGTSADAAG